MRTAARDKSKLNELVPGASRPAHLDTEVGGLFGHSRDQYGKGMPRTAIRGGNPISLGRTDAQYGLDLRCALGGDKQGR